MSSLWRSVRVSREARMREAHLREALTQNLSESVKGIQYQQGGRGVQHTVAPDLANALCAAVEAILIHGLKDTFFSKARSALAGDLDQKPQPSFWPLILVLSHRDNIRQITDLQNVSTEVGQCRAWIRIAINECLLSSYLSTIIRNMNLTKAYYSNSAYVRDPDVLDVANRLIEGIESCARFDLPINSSLLNSWPEEVLIASGAWMPAMRSCPVAPGVDVASTLTNDEPTSCPIPNIARGPTMIGIGQMLALDQDEAVNYILSNTPENFMDEINKNKVVSKDPSSSGSNQPVSSSEEKIEKDVEDNDNEDTSKSEASELTEYEKSTSDKPRPDFSVLGNSLCGKTAWSSDLNEEHKRSEISTSSNSLESPTPKSLTSLTDDSTNTSDQFVKTPNLRDVIKDLHKELKLTVDDHENKPLEPSTMVPISPDDPLLERLGFEVISKTASSLFDSNELQKMLSHLGSLSREYGLDTQDYQCKQCNNTIGTTASKFKVCAFSGEYFCTSCMDPNVFMIPARVVHNWDFHRYSVSKRVGLFLLEFQHQPLINLKKMNPLIYSGISEMAELQILRIQLNFLRAYLFTCREPVIEELQKLVWPREYLYDHVHVYSISDLAQICNGSLASQLQKIITFAQNHVKDCWLCSQKGFICEVCKNPKILYPFNIDSTYRCEACSSVFHSKCLNASKPCPKCERRKKRQNRSLIDVVHNNI